MGNWEDYLIENSSVLKNKLGITNLDELIKEENIIVTKKLADLILRSVDYEFNINHLRFIHYYLFSDIYEFAGRFRDVLIFKEQTKFTDPENIENELNNLIKEMDERLKSINYSNTFSISRYLADYYYRLIMIHPFREGNGRCIREYIREFSLNKFGYKLDYTKINRKNFLIGVKDHDNYPLLLAYEINNALVLKDLKVR